MFKRGIQNELKKWHQKKNRKPLIVRGASYLKWFEREIEKREHP